MVLGLTHLRGEKESGVLKSIHASIPGFYKHIYHVLLCTERDTAAMSGQLHQKRKSRLRAAGW